MKLFEVFLMGLLILFIGLCLNILVSCNSAAKKGIEKCILEKNCNLFQQKVIK